jgi:hypothetical protein
MMGLHQPIDRKLGQRNQELGDSSTRGECINLLFCSWLETSTSNGPLFSGTTTVMQFIGFCRVIAGIETGNTKPGDETSCNLPLS